MADEARYPALSYLAPRARRRIPFFAWEYLASGTGAEQLVARNRAALDAVRLSPQVAQGRFRPDTATTLFGQTFSVPFGAGPVGMSGLIWPGAELILARAARRHGLPYTLSMVANETPEAVAAAGGENVWFQLYPLKEPEIEADILARATAAGIRTLVVTLDVPVGSRRERQLAAGLTVPPRMTPRTLWRVAQRPAWALATLRHGPPRFRTLEKYFPTSAMADSAKMVGTIVDGRPDWATVKRLRDEWQGNLVIKGILSPDEAARAIECGADGVVVSNHGGGSSTPPRPPSTRCPPWPSVSRAGCRCCSTAASCGGSTSCAPCRSARISACWGGGSSMPSRRWVARGATMPVACLGWTWRTT